MKKIGKLIKIKNVDSLETTGESFFVSSIPIEKSSFLSMQEVSFSKGGIIIFCLNEILNNADFLKCFKKITSNNKFKIEKRKPLLFF